MRLYKLFILIFLLLLIVGCEKKISTKLHEVHWDRDMCERCVMVVSERRHALQAINPKNGKSYMFDDIGCWILWAKEENLAWEQKAILWITDANSGKWIDARKAYYDAENITPMAYGFMAHETQGNIPQDKEVITYKEVKKRVIKVGK